MTLTEAQCRAARSAGMLLACRLSFSKYMRADEPALCAPDRRYIEKEPEVRREGSTFTITLPASRPPGRMCAQVLVPFQRTVPVPVRDLAKGEYGIRSHGASASFTLDRDNSFNPR